MWFKKNFNKIALSLAVLGQSLAMGIWQWQSNAPLLSGNTLLFVINVIGTVATAASLEAVNIAVITHRKRHWSEWTLAFITSTLLTAISIWIASGVYGGNLEHSAFPIAIYFFGWFIAVQQHNEQKALEEEEKRYQQQLHDLPKSVQIDNINVLVSDIVHDVVRRDILPILIDETHKTKNVLPSPSIENIVTVEAVTSKEMIRRDDGTYECPNCHTTGYNKGHSLAFLRNGYCKKCKPNT